LKRGPAVYSFVERNEIIMACDNHTGTKNQITDEIATIITEMARNGIMSTTKQSRLLKRDYGLDVPPHVVSKYKYYERKMAWGLL
jgi:hypothetical protein